jgi:hypothetical protein
MSERVTRSKGIKREAETGPSSTEDKCSICLDSMSKMDPFKLPCGHSFHATCIMKNVVWGRLTCPLCRHKISKGQRRNDSANEEQEEHREENRDDLYDEELVRRVGNRIESKLFRTDVDLLLTRFTIPRDITNLSERRRILVLSEQMTHWTDNEEEEESDEEEEESDEEEEESDDELER